MSGIPKIIHYCWFGPHKVPNSTIKYINGWKENNKKFKIIRWSERNFNINKYKFTRRAYKIKDWAAVSDYVRLIVLKKYGGIYLDSDVEDVKSLCPLLSNNSFLGMESIGVIASGLIYGSKPDDYNVKKLLNIYNKISNSTNFDKYANDQVYITTMYFTKLGFKRNGNIQKISNCTIYPPDYFCPEKRWSKKIRFTRNTYTIHHYYSSWIRKSNSKHRFNIWIGDQFIRIFGLYWFRKIYSFLFKR